MKWIVAWPRASEPTRRKPSIDRYDVPIASWPRHSSYGSDRKHTGKVDHDRRPRGAANKPRGATQGKAGLTISGDGSRREWLS